MATNFPSSLDSLTNPTSSDSLASPSHASQHANVNDAVEALQAKVGVNGSAVTTSHDYMLANMGNWTTFTTVGTNCTIFSQACRYTQVNDVVHAAYRVDVSSITGIVTFTLPVTASNVAPFTNLGGLGTGLIINGSTYYYISPYVSSSTSMGLYYVPNASAATIVDNTTPVSAWDNFRVFITYQAA